MFYIFIKHLKNLQNIKYKRIIVITYIKKFASSTNFDIYYK